MDWLFSILNVLIHFSNNVCVQTSLCTHGESKSRTSGTGLFCSPLCPLEAEGLSLSLKLHLGEDVRRVNSQNPPFSDTRHWGYRHAWPCPTFTWVLGRELKPPSLHRKHSPLLRHLPSSNQPCPSPTHHSAGGAQTRQAPTTELHSQAWFLSKSLFYLIPYRNFYPLLHLLYVYMRTDVYSRGCVHPTACMWRLGRGRLPGLVPLLPPVEAELKWSGFEASAFINGHLAGPLMLIFLI